MSLTLQRITEIVRKAIPDLGPEEVRLLANEASDQFCQDTEILSMEFPHITTVADTIFYDIDRKCLGVRQVDIGGTPADALGGDDKVPMGD